MNATLPQEMQQHTYAIMDEVEGSHWWFVGRRRIIESFLGPICSNLKTKQPRILDIGCGTGANLEMLSQFGTAEGVDVSVEALAFCRERGLANVRQGAKRAYRQSPYMKPQSWSIRTSARTSLSWFARVIARGLVMQRVN